MTSAYQAVNSQLKYLAAHQTPVYYSSPSFEGLSNLFTPVALSLHSSRPATSSSMASKELPGSDSSTPLEGSNTPQALDPPSSNINDDQKRAPIPPDGGLMAWMQVAASWLILFNVLGLLNSYGQFQTIYETDILRQETASTISWIGSAQFLICYTICIFTGPVWDAGHVRFLLGVGTVTMVFGLMILSLCHEYYQFFLAQTVVTGVGFGFVFLPASGIVPQWFSTHAVLAIGIAMTGSSIGELVICCDDNVGKRIRD